VGNRVFVKVWKKFSYDTGLIGAALLASNVLSGELEVLQAGGEEG